MVIGVLVRKFALLNLKIFERVKSKKTALWKSFFESKIFICQSLERIVAWLMLIRDPMYASHLLQYPFAIEAADT